MSEVLRFWSGPDLRPVGPDRAVARMLRLWAPFRAPAPGSPRPPALDLDVSSLPRACADVNRRAVAACPWPAVHAGVVELRGRAVVVPGVSGRGKSTLVAALCRAGAGYVSDEALVVDPAGHAAPYPKPLALSPVAAALVGVPGAGDADGTDGTDGADGPDGAEVLVAPADLGALVHGPLPVGHVVLPARDPGHLGEPRLEPAPRGAGVEALVRLGFNHYRDPPRFLAAAASVVSEASVWRLRYRDAPEAARIIATHLP